MFGPKRVIGIERHPSGIRFVELVQGSDPPRVLNFGALVLPKGRGTDMPASGRWRKKLMAHAAISGPATEHEILSLPPMSKKELQAVVGRESKKTEGWVHAHQIIGVIDEGETKKLQVMIGSTLETGLKELRHDVEQLGLVPRLLTTPPIALQEALLLAEAFESIALVHFGAQGWYCVITQPNGFFFRPIHQDPDFHQDPDLYLDQVAQEIARTLLYYSQTNGGRSVERVFLSGELQLVAMMGEYLEGSLPVRLEIFRPVGSLDLSALGERTAEFQEALPSLAVALGLALLQPSRDILSLLPTEVQEQERERRNLLVTGYSAVAIVSLLAIAHLAFAYRISATQQLLKEKQETFLRLQPLVKEASKMKKARDLYKAVSPFLHEASQRGPAWLPLFKELSQAVTNEVVLQKLRITTTKDGRQFVLQGVASGSDSATVMAAFNRFYAHLNESPTFINLSPDLKLRHTTGSSTSSPSPVPTPSASPLPAQPRFEAVFEVKGTLGGELANEKDAPKGEGGSTRVL